jgi:RNA polymerase sigma-70 factor (ECF subfamily)
MENQESSDAAIVTRVLGGDREAYRFIVRRYQNRLHAMVLGMVRNQEDARDITQNAFIKAYESLGSFRIESSFYTWIYRISMNLAIDHCRRGQRRKTSSFDEAVGQSDEETPIDPLPAPDNPQKALQRKELQATILAALGQLPEEHREVVLLREVEGFSYKEIADMLDLPEGTVMSRLFYARKKLQTTLKELL